MVEVESDCSHCLRELSFVGVHEDELACRQASRIVVSCLGDHALLLLGHGRANVRVHQQTAALA